MQSFTLQEVSRQGQDFTEIAISKYLPVFEEKFNILGELKEGWERFDSSKEYEGFFIKLK